MCRLNYNIKNNKYKHITKSEREMIERWYNKDKKSKKEIAGLLNKSERTIRREIKRGLTINRTSEWIEIEVYSSQIAQDKYEYNLSGKGPELILDTNHKLVKYIEEKINNSKDSIEAIMIGLINTEFKDIKICAKTVRNAIKLGTVFNLKKKTLVYDKKYKTKNKNKYISKKTPLEKSIESRPEIINNRSEYGHWEGDLVIGKRKKGAVLFTLTERKTREEIIIKLSSKKKENVIKAIDKLERKYKGKFREKFKSITFDNGSEFNDYEAMEKSVRIKSKRTNIYYAHPYYSGERGSNENANRLIRRWIPKGTEITNISNKYIKKIENWINNYPRKIFEYQSTNMILSK